MTLTPETLRADDNIADMLRPFDVELIDNGEHAPARAIGARGAARSGGRLHHALALLGADVVVRGRAVGASVRQPDSALMDARWAFICESMRVKNFAPGGCRRMDLAAAPC